MIKVYCPNCGKEACAPEGANTVYCSDCGSPIDIATLVAPSPAYVAPQPVPQYPMQTTYPVNEPASKKKGRGGLIAIILLILLVLGGAAFGIYWFVFRTIPIESVSVKDKTIFLDVDKSCEIEYKITPAEYRKDSIIWESDDEDIATVEDGKITGVEAGCCEITATTELGDAKKVKIKVYVGAELTITKSSISTFVDETEYLFADFSIDELDDEEIYWESSNENVATVDDSGEVTAVGEGTCTITASTDIGLTAECKVKVEDKKENIIVGTWTLIKIFRFEEKEFVYADNDNWTMTIYADGTAKEVASDGSVFEYTWTYSRIDEDGNFCYRFKYKDGGNSFNAWYIIGDEEGSNQFRYNEDSTLCYFEKITGVDEGYREIATKAELGNTKNIRI